MFYKFFYELKKHGIPASLHEYLALMDALKKEVINYDLEEFYALSKAIFVKQESHLDRYDQIFDAYFKHMQSLPEDFFLNKIPKDWLNSEFKKHLTSKEREKLKKFKDLEEMFEEFRKILEEQNDKHEGGNKWIGVGGSSPWGAGGYHPEGFRMGKQSAGNRSAVKVWEKREFQNLDGNVEINTRNIKVALKYLRHFSREGIPDEFDLDGTIKKTSQNAGMLDIHMVPKKKNRIKVLLLMDVGGSMDPHVQVCEQLFSAARHEFKHLELFYFHNCIYESLWRDNTFRFSRRIPTLELIHKYGKDYKVIIVGDAAMSPYELMYVGGSVEHNNDIAGIKWLRMLSDHFKHMIWINPLQQYQWDFYETTVYLRQFMENRMFPMTIDGLVQGMKCLKNKKRTYKSEVWE